MPSSIHPLLAELNRPHLVHDNVLPFIRELKKIESVEVVCEGESYEGRDIYRIRLGCGPIVILAWTQMHGNEATATASVFDLIDSVLSAQDMPLNVFEQLFTLHIVPMLNPDGAQRCIRHNAQAIDINRDAMAQQTPEGRILMRLVDDLKPKVGFNLHDQSPYYQCGTNGNPSTIAFLAPAFNHEKDIDEARFLAMALIGKMTETISPHIPQCIARYDDTFSPRSFGDRIAERQVSTILIESGAARKDPNRQVARKMNVLAIRSALNALKDMHEQQLDEAQLSHYQQAYWRIHENTAETLSSLVIHNLRFDGEHPYFASISIKQTARYSDVFFIDAVGDLGIQAGLEEFDATGLCFDYGRPHNLSEPLLIDNQGYKDWLKKGVIHFHGEADLLNNQSDYSLSFNNTEPSIRCSLRLQQPAYFLMRLKGVVVAAVINGKLLILE
ncbi:peptidase M14 [Glaciecola sp. XM2]|jgi:hypothetical protein|uniref:M14 family zinc carboxypeptidase n=1 Tax=Glaciecola sp. XM2 TaxID=1914931 RepID=UPI001BDDDD52|nr:M14 family zinc carboxypeptidase [Glaciecola sp. XM2]MBT1452233.1 peptidase M14 [Glaciecola sp. XM2]